MSSSQSESLVLPPLENDDHTSFEFKPETTPVYPALAHHQVTEKSWVLSSLLAWLQTWAKIFDSEFELGLNELSLSVDWLPRRRLGHFKRGHNSFGLKSEIAINRRYLSSREPWRILGTLLHELLHAYQEQHGKPGRGNYHNQQFRQMAA